MLADGTPTTSPTAAEAGPNQTEAEPEETSVSIAGEPATPAPASSTSESTEAPPVKDILTCAEETSGDLHMDQEYSTTAMLSPQASFENPAVYRDATQLEPFLRPCILIFDSLIGSGHSRVFTNLRNYLMYEWITKRPNTPAREFTKVGDYLCILDILKPSAESCTMLAIFVFVGHLCNWDKVLCSS